MGKNILIYANKIAAVSETFIYFPALAMQRYISYFVGSRRAVDGLKVPEERVFIANGSKLEARVKQAIKQKIWGHNGVPDLAPKLKKLNPQLIQAHFGPESINALPLAQRLGIPLIIYYHGLDATMSREYALKNHFLRRYLKMLPRLQAEASLVLAQSDFIREKLLDWGFAPEKVRTHYIGIEAASEKPLALSERKAYVLFTGRLVEKKGLCYLIEAMKDVQAKYPELELVVAGNGILRDELEAQAANSLKNYSFLGWQTPQQVRQLMREARIFCVPSIEAESGDSEGFGMVFIEAQREGTPVVSSLHGGIVESVANGRTGLLAPEKDSSQLAQHIIRLYEDEQLWQDYSQTAYERVLKEFNLNSLVAGLENVYDEILGK